MLTAPMVFISLWVHIQQNVMWFDKRNWRIPATKAYAQLGPTFGLKPERAIEAVRFQQSSLSF